MAGVDGCRTGWVIATGPAAGDVRVEPSLATVVADVRAGRLAGVGIDMPIGLPAEPGPRACDVAARRLLGPRRSTVFPAPARWCLGRPWHEVRGLSKQAFHLLPKIAEVDALIDPSVQDRVFEVHPELAFARLTGAVLSAPKRTVEGRAARLAALGLSAVPRLRGAAPDDVLDALAVWHSTVVIVNGQASAVGDGTRDQRGLEMVIRW